MKPTILILTLLITVVPPYLLYWYASIYTITLAVLVYVSFFSFGFYAVNTRPSCSILKSRCIVWGKQTLPPPTPLSFAGIVFTQMLLRHIPIAPEIVAPLTVRVAGGSELRSDSRRKARSKSSTTQIKCTLSVYSYIVFDVAEVRPMATLQPDQGSPYFLALGIVGGCAMI